MTKKDVKEIYDEMNESSPALESNKLEYLVFNVCFSEELDDFVMHFAGNEAEYVLRNFAWRMWNYSQMYKEKEIENGL